MSLLLARLNTVEQDYYLSFMLISSYAGSSILQHSTKNLAKKTPKHVFHNMASRDKQLIQMVIE